MTSDPRKIGAAVADRAKTLITTERGTQHGDVRDSFQMIGEMWTTYINHVMKRRYPRLNATIPLIEPGDVAEMMALLKKARNVYGNINDPDHSTDDIGYTALAAGLRLENAVDSKLTDEIKEAFVSSNPDVVVDPPIPAFLRSKNEEA